MKRPLLVGIVNLTPDSFSGDGQLGRNALAHAAALVKQGADILDIGAESTRPGATALTAEEEWKRLSPFLAAVATQDWRASIRLSVDTYHAATAERSLSAGVDMINDVGGLRDTAMGKLLAKQNGDVIVMHALTLPADPTQVWPEGTDTVAALLQWKTDITAKAQQQGIAAERLVYDPGLGFGKTPLQSLELTLRAAELKASGGRWFYGHSRKSFLTVFGAEDIRARDELTLAFSSQLAAAGIDYLRVHAVEAHRALLDRLCH